MLATRGEMRNSPPSEYQSLDKAFESEINKAIMLTDGNYSNMNFRAAIKTGFFDLQVMLHYPFIICGKICKKIHIAFLNSLIP